LNVDPSCFIFNYSRALTEYSGCRARYGASEQIETDQVSQLDAQASWQSSVQGFSPRIEVRNSVKRSNSLAHTDAVSQEFELILGRLIAPL
jgi:hypothetical protein